MIYETNYSTSRFCLVKMGDYKVTQDDCKSILEKYFGDQAFNLLKFSLEPAHKELEEKFSTHKLLKIQVQHIDEVRDLTFLAKCVGKEGDPIVSLTSTQQMFKKELHTHSNFFKSVKEQLGNVKLNFVLGYYGNIKDSIMILEDPQEHGYKVPNGENLDKEHIKVGLETLAKLHALSIAYEEKRTKSLEMSYTLPVDFSKALEETLFTQEKSNLGYKYMQASLKGINAIIGALPESDFSREEIKEKLDKTLETLYDIINGAKYRRVFTHGDMWANSVTFRYEGNHPVSCKLLNFQFARYAPPAFDVAEWISSANGDFTKKCHYELLEHYYTNLKIQLKKYDIDIKDILSVDEFENTSKIAMSCAKILKGFYYTVSGLTDDHFKAIIKNLKEFNKFYYEDRSSFAINCYKNDSEYRNNITQIVENIIEDLKNDSLKIEDIYYIIEKDLQGKEFILMDYKMTPFGCYQDNLKLEINIMQEGSTKVLQYFVKKMPDISSVKEKSLFQNSFLKEHAWFRKMVPYYQAHSVEVDSVIPKCYFSRLHDVIAFEDLSKQGYVALYHRFSLTFDKVLLAIKKMASFHAKTIILEHRERIDQNTQQNGRFNAKFNEYFVESIYYLPEKACNTFTNAAKLGVLTLIDYFHDSQSKLSKEILKEQVLKIYDNLSDYLKPSKKYLNTTCHGDLSLHNLMFKFERNIPVDCAFVDFQSYRYAPPAHDLMSFIYLSTDREFRKVHKNKVIELYYDELKEILKAHGSEVAKLLPDYNVFLESCKYYKLFAIAQSAIHFHYTMLTEDQLKAFYAVPGLNDRMFFEDRSEFVTSMCNSDPVYKEKLRESILDLQEFCGSNSAMKKAAANRKQSKTEISFAPNVPYMAGRRYSQIGLD